MKKRLPLLLLFIAFSCNKEEINPPQPKGEERATLLKEKIFNGKTKWIITKMTADVERQMANTRSKDWHSQMPDCRTDNVFEFGEIGNEATHISVDEKSVSCSDNELSYIDDGVFLIFNSDFSKADVQIEGKAMPKLYGLNYDEFMEFEDYDQTWEIKEITENKLSINAIIIPDQSAGMVDEAANVTILFEKVN